jgi:predicted RNA-binding Zn ribbon-like protein
MNSGRGAFVEQELVGGHPVLDFLNTATARGLECHSYWVTSFGTLLDWAKLAKLIDSSEREQLRSIASTAPKHAGAALRRALQLRETLHGVVCAMAEGKTPPRLALADIESAWKMAWSRSRLIAAKGRIASGSDPERSGLDLISDRIVIAAVELFRAFPAGKVRRCRGENCGWWFVDRSKAGRRIWCNMATCGNVAKSRRHTARKRGTR